ncbi:hypothetical protein QYF36_017343 [Acer negundo]|nr:hypothetical protein QYF36_017343 [Acer negundo]
MSTLTHSVDSSFNDNAADHVFLSHPSTTLHLRCWITWSPHRLDKLFVANQNKFYDEADKNYWKAIAELLPIEVPTIEKRKVNKDQEKKPSIVVTL